MASKSNFYETTYFILQLITTVNLPIFCHKIDAPESYEGVLVLAVMDQTEMLGMLQS